MKIKPQIPYGERVRAQKAEAMAIDIRQNAMKKQSEDERTKLAARMQDTQERIAADQARFARAQFAITTVVSLRDKPATAQEETDAAHNVILKALKFVDTYFDDLNNPKEDPLPELSDEEKATIALEGAGLIARQG